MNELIRQFLFPALTRRFVIRILVVGLLTYLFFGRILVPMRIRGSSMEPTCHDGAFKFYWRQAYLFSKPGRNDIVTVRFAGQQAMLLKRVVAVAGDRVEFREGKLFVNDRLVEEPYVRWPSDWVLPPRIVEKESVYVVGDNRSMRIEDHYFGQAPLWRVMGRMAW